MGRIVWGSIILAALGMATTAGLCMKKMFTAQKSLPQELTAEAFKHFSLKMKWKLACENLSLWGVLIQTGLLPAYSMPWQRNIRLKSCRGNNLLFHKVIDGTLNVYVTLEENFPTLQHHREFPSREDWAENWMEGWTAQWKENVEGHRSVTIEIPRNGRPPLRHTIKIGSAAFHLVVVDDVPAAGLAILLH